MPHLRKTLARFGAIAVLTVTALAGVSLAPANARETDPNLHMCSVAMPERVSAVRNLDRTVTVKWQPPKSLQGTIAGYEVLLDAYMPEEKSFPVSAATRKYTFRDPNPRESLYIELRVNVKCGPDNKGYGWNSQPMFFKGADKKAALNDGWRFGFENVTYDWEPKAKVLSPSSVKVSWPKPKMPNGRVKSATLTVYKDYGIVVKTIPLKTTALSATVTGLSENTGYSFEVAVSAVSANESFESTTGVMTNNVRTPLSKASTVKVGQPVGVKASAKGKTVKVTWYRPAVTGTVTGYEIKVGSKTYKVSASTRTKSIWVAKKGVYTVQVRAIAKSGNAKYSAAGSWVTKTVRVP